MVCSSDFEIVGVRGGHTNNIYFFICLNTGLGLDELCKRKKLENEEKGQENCVLLKYEESIENVAVG